MRIMDTVGLMLFMLHFPFIVCASPFVPNLRGRQLQSGNSGTVAPRCKPGYKDVTNGQAFYWSCAFHCEGGAYYATTGCVCACLTAEQEAIWRANGGTSQALQAPTSGNASSTVDVVTRAPQPTRAPSVPVVEIPVGEFGGESRWVPPKQSYTMPTMPTTPPEDTEDPTDRDAFSAHFGMLALLFGGIVVCTALVGLVCFNWDRLRRCPHDAAKRREKNTELWAIPAPVAHLHPAGLGVEQRPQPSQVVAVDMTKSSSKGNGLSMPSFDAPNRKDTRSLLKLPVTSDLNSISSMSTYSGSGTNSINSQALARPAPRIQDSNRKISKVQPI